MHMLTLIFFRLESELTAFQLQVVLLLLVLLPSVPTKQHGSGEHHSCTRKLPTLWTL